jgi:hypothetical protein
MTDRKAARVQLVEWLLAAHRHSQINGQSDRDGWVNAWLAAFDLVMNQVVDLSPMPPKQPALTPIPPRPVIDSIPKLQAARKRLVELGAEERKLAAMSWNTMEARHEDRLRFVRNEMTILTGEIRVAAAMERTAHAG